MFTVSLLGQLLNGVRDPEQLSTRAAGDTVFGLTYALWSLRLQDEARKWMIQSLPGRASTFKQGMAGLTAFTIGSAINNYVYSKGAIHLLEPELERYVPKPWW